MKEEEAARICPSARSRVRRAGCSAKFKESMANSAYSAARRVEMKTEREDFSSRALLAINMKKEMLRRMLHYIVIVQLVRAQRYMVPTLVIYLYFYDDAKKQKDALSYIRSLYSSANTCCG